MGSYGSLFVVLVRSSVVLGVPIVARGEGIVAELDCLVLLEFRLSKVKDGGWDIGIVDLDGHDPGSDRCYRVWVERGKSGRNPVHVRGCSGIAGRHGILIGVNVCRNRHS